MAKEYLVVNFPTSRSVLLNGQSVGSTNVLLEVDGGNYTVTLDPSQGSTPDKIVIDLHNTSAFLPLTINFTQVTP